MEEKKQSEMKKKSQKKESIKTKKNYLYTRLVKWEFKVTVHLAW